MDNDTLKRLDFFALETLVRCMLRRQLMREPSLESELVRLFESSVDGFRLTGADADKIPEFQDYMKQRGLQWIAQASPPSDTPPR